jgi:hypothetical protein
MLQRQTEPTMSVRVSQEFFIEFLRWSDQFFKQWRDDIASCWHEQLISLLSPSENPQEKQPTKEAIAPPPCKDPNPNDHNHSINPHDPTHRTEASPPQINPSAQPPPKTQRKSTS